MVDLGRIPGAVVIPNCVQVALRYQLTNGHIAHNVLHGEVGGGFAPTTAIANTVFGSLSTSGVWDTLAAYLGGGFTFAGVSLLDMRVANQAAVESTDAAAPGTSAVVDMAPQTALAVTLRTAFAGTGFRGRFYMPGWTTDAAGSNGRADGGAVIALQAWADTIPTVLAASGLNLCLAHPARAAYTGSTGAAHAARDADTVPVTSLVVRNNQWDTQRRRAGRT